MLILGEVRTCLLHNSSVLPRTAVDDLLAVRPGERVSSTERPVPRAVSPDLLEGVDCQLPTRSGTKASGIGTAITRAVVTAGLVLQASSSVRVTRASNDRRVAWEHYAERPGTVDVTSRADVRDLGDGHLRGSSGLTALDLGSLSERLITSVQMRPQLDRVTVIRARPLWIRWAAELTDTDRPTALVEVRNDNARTIRLVINHRHAGVVAQFCEDFALHDWLLTTLGYLLELVERGGTPRQDPVDILRAAIDRLVHVWMPGAHVDPALRVFWDSLERRPGFSLQWNTQVARVRDQIALRSLRALERLRHGDANW
ncbi:SCO2521 family protein [Actinokineospora soli]|uniref:SCO2521 family protein n=1 Tax=Actinokineospora soli TaxID=1048753 RepID=A0ABW2TPM0_9PSEU